MEETQKVIYTDEMVDILYDKLFRQDKEYDKEFSETDSEPNAKGIILFSSEKLVLTLMAEFIKFRQGDSHIYRWERNCR